VPHVVAHLRNMVSALFSDHFIGVNLHDKKPRPSVASSQLEGSLQKFFKMMGKMQRM
jgi:hypothetical protein